MFANSCAFLMFIKRSTSTPFIYIKKIYIEISQDSDKSDEESDEESKVINESEEAEDETQVEKEPEKIDKSNKSKRSKESKRTVRICMSCDNEVEDFMSEEERYKPFKYACYDCYKELYKRDPDRYERHKKKYKKKQGDDVYDKVSVKSKISFSLLL